MASANELLGRKQQTLKSQEFVVPVMERLVLKKPKGAPQTLLSLHEFVPRLLHAISLQQQQELKVAQQTAHDVQVDECRVRLLLALGLNRLISIPFKSLKQRVLPMPFLSLEFMATACEADAVAVLNCCEDLPLHFFNRSPLHRSTSFSRQSP
jgi:hypothetical protein